MVTMTDRAGELLHRLQEAESLNEPLRLVSDEGTLALTASNPDPADEILYHGDAPVLRVSPDAATALTGCTLATKDTPEGPRLAILREEESPDGRASS
jgi:hypothetical protein